jgi:hypothetical protein
MYPFSASLQIKILGNINSTFLSVGGRYEKVFWAMWYGISLHITHMLLKMIGWVVQMVCICTHIFILVP